MTTITEVAMWFVAGVLTTYAAINIMYYGIKLFTKVWRGVNMFHVEQRTPYSSDKPQTKK